MKPILSFLVLILLSTVAIAQVSKTVNVTTAGTLSSLASAYLTTVTDLTITGNMDARDMKCIDYNMKNLKILNLSEANIVSYTGKEGTYGAGSVNFTYAANTIPNCAFRGIQITSITLPPSITSIDYEAFGYCSSLKSINIPSSVTNIGGGAFNGCTGLTSIIIPASVTSIESTAFYDCSGLTTVTIPSSVTSIGADAFKGCTGLTSSNISISVTTAGTLSSLLSKYPSPITTLIITGSIDKSDFETLQSKSSLVVLNISGTTIVAYSSNYPDNTIPSYAFQLNTKITSIVLPSSVTSIGTAAFSGCKGLSSINIPSSTTSIGSYAFSGCTSLTSITIPASVTSINGNSFGGSSGSITVEPSNSYYSSLNGVLFSKDQTTLISYTIFDTGNYIIPSSVTSIGSNAFIYCKTLTSVTIPSSVTSIGDHAFDGTKLTSVTIPSSVTSIGSYAFTGTGLTSVTIPSSVTSFGGGVFQSCTGLTSVTIQSGVTAIVGSTFDHCSGITSVYIPSSVTSIDWGAFRYCTGLTSVNIPSSVTYIGTSAFQDCSSLTSIYVYPTTPVNLSSVNEVFYHVNKNTCNLYVPLGSATAYRNSVQWKDFTNIIEKTTGIHPINQSNIKIMTGNGNVTIENATIGDKVQIYSVSGAKIRDQAVVNNQTSISLHPGVYVIRIGNHSDKFIIK
jgi:hypothetical protein